MLKFPVVNDLLSTCRLSTACMKHVFQRNVFLLLNWYELYFVFSRVARTNKLGHHGSVWQGTGLFFNYASFARSDEMDSSDEGAADHTILKPSFLPRKTLD